MDRIFQKKIQQQAQESFVNTSLNNQKNNFFDLLKAFLKLSTF
jgi:hypothetical protein